MSFTVPSPAAYTRTSLVCGCALVERPVAHLPGCFCGKEQHPPRVERIYCGEHEKKTGEDTL